MWMISEIKPCYAWLTRVLIQPKGFVLLTITSFILLEYSLTQVFHFSGSAGQNSFETSLCWEITGREENKCLMLACSGKRQKLKTVSCCGSLRSNWSRYIPHDFSSLTSQRPAAGFFTDLMLWSQGIWLTIPEYMLASCVSKEAWVSIFFLS